MLKYPCYCLNCENHTETGKCLVSSTSCILAQSSHKCPVTKCLMFKPKSIFAQKPCAYFENIENGGLKLA